MKIIITLPCEMHQQHASAVTFLIFQGNMVILESEVCC